ncbi:MAG: hypothetical protein SPD47_11375, partial [Oscillospiraceae bacterium]|nr:hypothetical protein [Oscillospiraceae bacterium]
MKKASVGIILLTEKKENITATAFTFSQKRCIIGNMNIEELKMGIKNIKEPRRTGYGNIRHKLED